MKKNYLFVFVLCSISLFSYAQITLTSADLPVAGLAFTTAHDDNYVAAIPAGGAAQTWNYSTLINSYQDTAAFISSVGTPFAAQFSSANLASYSPSSGNYYYFTSSATGFYQNGGSDTTITAGYALINPPYLFVPTPFTYLDTRQSTARLEILLTIFDSTLGNINIKVIQTINSTFLCDGWGSLQLPNATHNNTIRIKVTEVTIDSIFADLTGFGFYTFIQADSSLNIDYRWFGNGSASYLLGITADSAGTTSVSSEYLLNSVLLGTSEPTATQKKVQVFPNPASENATFAWSQENVTGLTIFNGLGQSVISAEMNGLNRIELPVSSLPAGIYYYQLTTENSILEKGKFSVAR